MKPACLGKKSCQKQGIKHQTKPTFRGMALFKIGSRCEMRDQALRTQLSSIPCMTPWPDTYPLSILGDINQVRLLLMAILLMVEK